MQFDVAVDPQSLTKSALLAWLSGARCRIGLARPLGRELAPLFDNHVIRTSGPHVVQHMLQLLEPLDCGLEPVEFRLPILPESVAQGEGILQSAGLTERFVAINPGAGSTLRRWPTERYAEVARRVWQVLHVPSLIVWGNPFEQELANQIAALAGEGARVAPPTTLPTLLAVLRRATCLVSGDTGPLHLAAAVNTPCVGIYGPTWPEFAGPFGDGHIVIRGHWRAPHPLGWRSAPRDVMLSIAAEDVFLAGASILDRNRA